MIFVDLLKFEKELPLLFLATTRYKTKKMSINVPYSTKVWKSNLQV